MRRDIAARRVAVVVNPVHARSQAALAEVLDVCRDLQLPQPDVPVTPPASPGAEQARAAVAAGADRVVVIGGDGTVREVASALSGTQVPLGVVATGTANLYARNTGLLEGSLRARCVAAVAGALRPVDVGRARLRLADGSTRNETFLVVTGLGHDAATITDVSPAAKQSLGWLAYFGPGLRRLAAPPLQVSVSLDGGPARQTGAWSVLVASCGRIPAGVQVVPGTAPDDGLLHVAVVSPATVADWAGIAASGMAPHRVRARGLTRDQVRTVTVSTPRPSVAQVDGDPVEGVVTLRARVEPGTLLLSTPPAGDAPVDTEGLGLASVAALAHELHHGHTPRAQQEAVVDLLTSLHGEDFREVKYRLNSSGDVHDLEHLVFDHLDADLRERLLAHIASEAVTTPTRDVRILCDIDDTVRSALHDRRVRRGTVYPGIVALLNALDDGGAADPGRAGDLTFVTARPGGPLQLLEQYTLGGLEGWGLPPHTVMSGTLLTLTSPGAMGRRKQENIRRDRVLFPECRMVFLGDSGQADPEVALEARRHHGEHLVVAWIHDVTGLGRAQREALAREGVLVVDTWDEAARDAERLGLVTPAGRAAVERAVAAGLPAEQASASGHGSPGPTGDPGAPEAVTGQYIHPS